MRNRYYQVSMLILFSLGIILATREGLRSIGLIFFMFFFIGAFIGEGLDEAIQFHKSNESSVWLSRLHCIRIIGTNIIPPVLIIGILMEIMKSKP